MELIELVFVLRESTIAANHDLFSRTRTPEEFANYKLLEWLSAGAEAALTKKLAGMLHPPA